MITYPSSLLIYLLLTPALLHTSEADVVLHTKFQPATSLQDVTWNILKIHRKSDGSLEYDEWILNSGGIIHTEEYVATGVTFDKALTLIFTADTSPHITIGLADLEARSDMQQEVIQELQKNPAFKKHPPLTRDERRHFVPNLYELIEPAILKTSFVQDMNQQLLKRGRRIKSSISMEELRIIRHGDGYVWLANGALEVE